MQDASLGHHTTLASRQHHSKAFPSLCYIVEGKGGVVLLPASLTVSFLGSRRVKQGLQPEQRLEPELKISTALRAVHSLNIPSAQEVFVHSPFL